MFFLLFSENPKAGEHPECMSLLEVLNWLIKAINLSLKLSVRLNSVSYGTVDFGLTFFCITNVQVGLHANCIKYYAERCYHNNDDGVWWITIHETLSSFSYISDTWNGLFISALSSFVLGNLKFWNFFELYKLTN